MHHDMSVNPAPEGRREGMAPSVGSPKGPVKLALTGSGEPVITSAAVEIYQRIADALEKVAPIKAEVLSPEEDSDEVTPEDLDALIDADDKGNRASI